MGILIVDDEQVALNSVKRILQWQRYTDIATCGNGECAIEAIRSRDFDVVLLDILMPGVDGLEVLATCKPLRPQTEFIVLSAVDDVATAMKAVRMGAFDYLVKPVNNDRLLLTIERAFERRGMRCRIGACEWTDDIPEAFRAILTHSRQMKQLIAYAEIMARSGNPVLITGESGTGKELMARAIHLAGPTPSGPFVPVNVASVPESMFEGLFFGFIKGAFTGAQSDQQGYFESANGGTLFLDEIGEIPAYLQAKLLRALEEKQVTRLGSSKPISLRCRIVSATNIEIDQACREGRLRLDLLYRLKSAHVHLPPLWERTEDIPLLARYFLDSANREYHKNIRDFTDEAMQLLQEHDYPGNVRELAQIVQNGVIMCDDDILQADHLALARRPQQSPPLLTKRSLCTFKENHEQHLAYVLQQTRGDRQQAADILGVSLRHIHRKIAELEAQGHSPYPYLITGP